MRNKTCAVFLVLIACSVAVTASAQMVPMRQGYVSDYVGVLGSETHQQLARDLAALRNRDNVEMNVVVIDSLHGYSVEDFSRTMANYWHIGDDLGNRGVLLLFAPVERKVRIEVGRGLVSVLPDALTSRIIQSAIVPPWKSGDRDRAVLRGVSELIDILHRSAAPAVNSTPMPAPVMQRAMPEAPIAASTGGTNGLSLGINTVIAFGVLIGFGVFLLLLHRRNIAAENHEKLQQCNERMELVRARHDDAQNAMIDLQTRNPAEVWQEMRNRLNDVAARDLDRLELTLRGMHTAQRRGLGQQASVRERIGVWMAETDNVLAFFQIVFALRKKLEVADEQVARLRQNLPKRLRALQEEVDQTDVSEKTRQIVIQQAAQLAEVERSIRKAPTLNELNMLVLQSQLTGIQVLLEGVANRAREDKAQAEQARAQVPILLKRVEGRLAGASRDHDAHFLGEARRQFQEAQSVATGDNIDWALAYMLLNNANHNCDRAAPPPPAPITHHYEDPSPSFTGHGITATLPDFSPDPSPISTPDFSPGFDGNGSSGDL